MLVLVGLFLWTVQVLGNANLYPECEAHMHNLLQEPTRKHETNQIDFKLNDVNVAAGWYRIFGQAGNRLLDISDLPKNVSKRNVKDFFPCGRKTYPEQIQNSFVIRTDYFYVLTESHPTEVPARISTTVSLFRYRAVQRIEVGVKPPFPEPKCETTNIETLCYWKAEVGSSTIEISVTNCGDFYVYFLQPITAEALTRDRFFHPPPFNRFNPNPLPPVYCTTSDNIHKVSHCRNYVNVTDPSMFWNAQSRSVSDIKRSCQDQQFVFWTRFLYDNITNAMIQDTCIPSQADLPNPPCGSLYRGWIQGEHPSPKEGRVKRTVCFSLHESCRCLATMPIDVMNCGSFYIYKTPASQPRCYSRICLEKQKQRDTFSNSTEVPLPTSRPTKETKTTLATMNYTASTTYTNLTFTGNNNKSTETTLTTTEGPAIITKSPHKPQNLCENYATVVDDSRLFSNPLEENKCDFYFKTAVRFMTSKGGNLQLKDNCSNGELNELRFYCGSAGLTYIEQLHPEKSDVPSQVSVCINTFFDTVDLRSDDIFPSQDCKCNSRQNILVQNCSGFYVYQIVPIVPISRVRLECPARYCTEELSVQPTPSTTRSTTATTIVSQPQQPARYGVEGKLQIMQPMLNYRKVTTNDLVDKNSMDYIFLMSICTDILNRGLQNVEGIKTKQITGLRIGSLIADYIIILDRKVNVSSLEKKIGNAFKAMRSVDVTIEDRTFSGQINSTQPLTDFNECAISTTCDPNAQCTNSPDVFSFQCKCNEGFEGNGFSCTRIIKVTDPRINETRVEVAKWSDVQIALVSAAFVVAFVLIVILACAICYFKTAKKNTYEANSFKHNNYDQYVKSDRLEKIDGTKLNMYVAVEPTKATHKSFEHEMVIKNGNNFDQYTKQ